MANKFIPAGFDASLYRKAVQNKDSYGNDTTIVQKESPTRVDTVDENNVYVGWAEFGANEDSPVWKIKKIENNSEIYSEKYADGNKLYDNVWSDRKNLKYL
ncbi:MAG: hypothetical protein ACOC2U_03780 [bacterium]